LFNGATDVAWTDVTGVDVASIDGFSAGTITLGSNLAANSVVLGLPGYTITGANTLTIAGATPTLSDNPLVVGTSTISAPVTIGTAQTWTIGSASTLIDSNSLTSAAATVLTKAGAGTLTLSGNNSGLAGGVTLSAGTLNLGSANALGTGTFIMSGNAGILGNSSGGTLVNAGNNAITLNASPTFNLANNLNLGTGTVTFGANRAPIINGATLTLGPLAGGASSLTKHGSGTLVIDNASNVYLNTTITAGTLNLGTTGVMGGVTGTLSVGGGELRMAGVPTGQRIQSTSTYTPNGGRDTITLVADPAQNINLNSTTIGTRAIYMTGLYRGTNLGTASIASASANVANIVYTTAPSVNTTIQAASTFAATGTGTVGTTQAAVLRGALYDGSAAGNGTAFATYDPANGVRGLNSATEQNTTYPAATSNDNALISLVGATAITGVQTNTLQVDNVSGAAQTLTNTGTALFPVNGLLFSGNSAITLTGGTLTTIFGANVGDGVVLSTNTAGVTIASNFNISGSAERGITFGGPGNITVNGTLAGQGGNGAVSINGPGTVTLNSTTTTSSKGIIVAGGTCMLGPSFTMTSSRLWQVGAGATLDLNGTSVANVEGFTETNLATGAGITAGVITNSSATPATLTVNKASNNNTSRSSVVSITGNLNVVYAFSVAGTGTQTMTGQSTYTGTTTISSGNLIAGITNALPVGTALTITGGGADASLLSLAGVNQTIGSLSGNSTATISNSTASSTSVLNINGGAGATYSGVLANGTGTLALVKSGSGTEFLAGANTYTGGTVVTGGLLSVINPAASSGTGTGPVTVLSGGTLGGNGFIITAANAGVTVAGGGMLSPGTSPGTLSMDLGSGSLDIRNAVAATNSQSMLFDLDTPGTSDQVKLINAASSLNIGNGKLEFDDFVFTPTGSFGAGTYTLFDTTNSISGSLGANLSGTIGSFNAVLSTADSGHDIVLTVTSVPEPSTCVLLGLGIGAIGLVARRSRKKA
jgi:autotransporter-associated beta strand protein